MHFSGILSRSALALLMALSATHSNARDGDLDPAFGTDGVIRSGLVHTQANAMAVRPDGRIVVCGSYSDQDSWTEEFFVAQYLPEGSLDPAFGNNGIAYIDASASADTCTSLAIQPDGRIVAAGYTAMPQFPGGASYHPVIARLLPGGALDSAFGNGGVVTYAQSGDAAGVAV